MRHINFKFPVTEYPPAPTAWRIERRSGVDSLVPTFYVRTRVQGSEPERIAWSTDEATARRFADMAACWFKDTERLNYSLAQVAKDMQEVPEAVAVLIELFGERPERKGRTVTLEQRITRLEQQLRSICNPSDTHAP